MKSNHASVDVPHGQRLRPRKADDYDNEVHGQCDDDEEELANPHPARTNGHTDSMDGVFEEWSPDVSVKPHSRRLIKHQVLGTSCGETIRQSELRELADLLRADYRRRELRRCIVERLSRGATIEPGKLSASLLVQDRRVCSWRKLAAILGEAQMQRIKEVTKPTECEYLHVYMITPRGPKRLTGRTLTEAANEPGGRTFK
jgi:hypothetical protein